jgi:nitroreductase
LVDTSFATMLLLLGLTQEGLGSLFFALQKPAGPLLRALAIPDGWEPLGAVAIGWSSGADRPSTSAGRPRKPLAEVVHRGRWGRH